MERPPGMLALGGGPGMDMGPAVRLIGGPTGMFEGREPWGALRQGLDEVLALGLGDERLELGGGEGVD